MASHASVSDLKSSVTNFWNAEPCGTRCLGDQSNFEAQAAERYRLEPYIPEFAQFSCSKGLKVLEIGVGMGADYAEWLKAGAIAKGVDLSSESIARARARCEAARLPHDLRVADAEDLPFPDESFDLVYSYGVMHHSPNTAACIDEAWRVLKASGKARIMLYHHASVTGIMLWLRYGMWRGQSIRQCVYQSLESPGTKTFTLDEVRSLMHRFQDVKIRQVFSPGDLLENKPSSRFQGWLYRLAWKAFPRKLVRVIAPNLGLFLLIEAVKPE